VEAAVAQWYWLEDCFKDADQFNSIHEKLVAKWKDLKDYVPSPAYFADGGSEEDRMTVSYLRDTAEQGGLRTRHIAMHEIGWDAKRSRFVDLDNHGMETLFKLYPWEWLLSEPFGPQALSTLPPAGRLAAVRPAQGSPPVGFDAVDRADLEDALVEQGAAGHSLGAEPRP
jgi:glutathionylspermidine synthase